METGSRKARGKFLEEWVLSVVRWGWECFRHTKVSESPVHYRGQSLTWRDEAKVHTSLQMSPEVRVAWTQPKDSGTESVSRTGGTALEKAVKCCNVAKPP